MAGGTLISERGPLDSFFNLPVVLAFSLLDEVLGDFAAQGAYSVRSGAMLGEKMSASKQSICWLDYAEVEAAKNRRNKLAHNGELISKIDCLQIVELVGNELRNMGAID